MGVAAGLQTLAKGVTQDSGGQGRPPPPIVGRGPTCPTPVCPLLLLLLKTTIRAFAS